MIQFCVTLAKIRLTWKLGLKVEMRHSSSPDPTIGMKSLSNHQYQLFDIHFTQNWAIFGTFKKLYEKNIWGGKL